MTSLVESLDRVRKDKALSGPAQRLIEKLSLIPGEDLGLYEGRWFWELLQNARDSGDIDDPPVNVRLVIETERVVFSHNGPPFDVADADNLITPDSNKRAAPGKRKKIGRFGTGFISTHVLSGVITVQCVVKESGSQAIEYLLDRRGYEDKKTLEASLDSANEQLRKQLDDPTRPDHHSEDGFNTRFIYDLRLPLQGTNTHNALHTGLRGIMEVLPYTLVFLTDIGQVEIINSTGMFSLPDRMVFRRESVSGDEILVHSDVIVGGQNQPRRTRRMHVASTGTATVCACLEKDDLGKDRIVPLSGQVPRLFNWLPILAKEPFCSPVVIHSEAFNPKDDRQDISLADKDGNWDPLLDGTRAYQGLLERLGKAGVAGLYHLASWPAPKKRSNDIDEKLEKDILSAWNKSLLTTPVVWTATGMKALGEVRIPFVPRDKYDEHRLRALYDLLKLMPGVVLPVWEDAVSWLNASDGTQWGKDRLYTIKQVVDTVSEWGSLEVLSQHIKTGMEWLVQLLQHVATYCPDYLASHAIIPDAEGVFRKQAESLHWGHGTLPPELVQIYDGLHDVPYGVKLIHPDVLENEQIKDLSARKNTEDLCAEIDAVLKARKLDERQPAETELSAIKRLEEWAELRGNDELKRLFDWYARRRSHIIFWTMTSDEKVRVLGMKEEDKIAVLAELGTKLSKEDLTKLAEDPASVLMMLNDPSAAQTSTGSGGEDLVHAQLRIIYPEERGFTVLESHKDGVGEFDFEVRQGFDTVLYVDAKSTSARMSDSDKVLIRVRPKQWEFLRKPDAQGKYVLARPFLGDAQQEVQWLAVRLMDKSLLPEALSESTEAR